MNNTLTAKDIKEVQNFAREKLGLCRKENDIIGTQIFSILVYMRELSTTLLARMPYGDLPVSAVQEMMQYLKNLLSLLILLCR